MTSQYRPPWWFTAAVYATGAALGALALWMVLR